MIKFIKNLLGITPPVHYKNLVNDGAVIIDVRSKDEYKRGHIKGSFNIPVDSIKSGLKTIGNKDTPIITYCASGMRSAAAITVLKSLGYTCVYNGGGMESLKEKIK